jgi:GT2 family glycosyltransferase
VATSPARLGIVIVNWNGTSDTVDCLASIRASTHRKLALNVIVVDNGSEADPTAQIKSAAPEARVILLGRNAGFAGGCNVGIEQALAGGADYVLLLNNDAVVREGGFESLLESFAEDSKIGIVGPLIYESDRRAVDFAGAKINFALGRFRHVQSAPPTNAASSETDYVSGACMMLSRALLERVGLLDEKLFAYFEDVDLCLRARNAGFRLLFVPAASVIHKGSASTRRTLAQGTTSPMKHYLIARNRSLVVKRYASTLARVFYFGFTTPMRVAFYTAAFVLKFRWKKLRAFWRGTIDGVRNESGAPSETLFR